MKMKIISLLIVFILAVSPLSAQTLSPLVPGGAPQSIGIVAAVRGVVQITSQGQVGKIAGSGQPVYLGDAVSTDGKGSLQILLLDQTVFTIGPNSSIVIDKFVYDPATDDGEVKAKVVKGVFRFVTGKIGQKKPQQMEVDLPAGTIGIRGTIVAGEVAGKHSKIILLGPGEKNNTGHRGGKFILSNESGGQLRQETVSKTGFGSIIDGEGSAPTRPFQVPAQDLARITTALGPVAAPDPAGQNPPGGEGSLEGKNASPTEQSGQGKVMAGEAANQARAVGRMMQRFTSESNQNAQRVNNVLFEIKDGPTSRDQLQAAAQKMGGIAHFQSLNVPLTGAYTSGAETASFNIDIDFGARRVGGGFSSVVGTIKPSTSALTFSIALTNTQPFGFGADNAQFVFPVASVSGSCGAFCDNAIVNVGVDNRGGNIAQEAHMQVKIFDGGIEKAQAVTVGAKADGPTPP